MSVGCVVFCYHYVTWREILNFKAPLFLIYLKTANESCTTSRNDETDTSLIILNPVMLLSFTFQLEYVNITSNNWSKLGKEFCLKKSRLPSWSFCELRLRNSTTKVKLASSIVNLYWIFILSKTAFYGRWRLNLNFPWKKTQIFSLRCFISH